MGRRIAVIGGGASAVLLLAQMARLQTISEIETIDVYDRVGAFGKGVAYATNNAAHPLNVRAANMSGYADQKENLVEWLAVNEPSYTPSDFIPRMVYGRYLAHLFKEAQNVLPVRLIKNDVAASKYNPGHGYDVTVNDVVVHYDEVIVASGNVRPIGIEVDEECARYYKSPYGLDYSAIKKDGRVVILGSGLSAVDAILGVDDAGFKGEINIVSKKGWFPARHSAPQAWAALDTPLNNRGPAEWMKVIRAYVGRAVDAGLFWQSAIDSLRVQTNPIWNSLTERQRDTFMRHGLSAWNIHRHRMPPESADRIDALKEEGRLKNIKDRAVRIDAHGHVHCRNVVIEGADAIINGLGYRYDEKGRQYDASYKIGPANFGELFETTAIPEIRAQAADIAQKLMQ